MRNLTIRHPRLSPPDRSPGAGDIHLLRPVERDREVLDRPYQCPQLKALSRLSPRPWLPLPQLVRSTTIAVGRASVVTAAARSFHEHILRLTIYNLIDYYFGTKLCPFQLISDATWGLVVF
jgi:hypothetical protein